MRHTAPVLALLSFFGVACASSSPDPTIATSSTAASTQAAPDVVGRWAFALDESDPAPKIRAHCNVEAAGDAAKADACYAKVRVVASREGIRFEKDSHGTLTWISYGAEQGAEEVYHQAPVEVAMTGPVSATARLLAAATGSLAAERPIPQGKVMRMQIEGNDTIVVLDENPEKGRLVFHRVSPR